MFDRKNARDTDESPEIKPAAEAPRPTPQVAPQGESRNSAVIGSTVKVRGEILSEENLIVEGEVEGSISVTDNELVIGRSGRIKADIHAKSIRIDGEVDGDIDAKEKVLISQSGNVQGNLVAPRVVLEDGGRLKGNVDMGPDVSSAGGKPNASRTESKPASTTASAPTPDSTGEGQKEEEKKGDAQSAAKRG